MIKVTVPLLSLGGGSVVIPADQVTAILHTLADDWIRLAGAGEMDLDGETVRILAGLLGQLADQIDVECIALTCEPDP